jgi:hypothetical protein
MKIIYFRQTHFLTFVSGFSFYYLSIWSERELLLLMQRMCQYIWISVFCVSDITILVIGLDLII